MPTDRTINDFQAWLLGQIATGARRIAVVGGWGCGKTHGIALAMEALSRSRPDEDGMLVYPRAAQAARAFGSLAESVLVPLGWVYCATYQGMQAPHWRAPNGVKVWVNSYHRPGTRDVGANSLEGGNVGWGFIDEAPAYVGGDEVAQMAWGRVRAGARPFLCVVGRPSMFEWWPKWATEDGGAYIRVSSAVNSLFIPGWPEFVAGMTKQQQEERLHCMPQSPEGAVYSQWRPTRYPDGNITPPGWKYDPAMRGYLAVDWGRRHPSALVIVEDPVLGADVIAAELNPEGVSIHEFAGLLWRIARPRRDWTAGTYAIDAGVGDKAGQARHEQTVRSNFEALARSHADGGFGLMLTCAYQRFAERVNIANGVRQVRDRIHHDHHGRRLLMTPEAWAASTSGDGVSFARALQSYVYRPGTDTPAKNGQEHPLDALRYFVAEFRWYDEPPPVYMGPARRSSRYKAGLR